ncbi:MAG: 50S ribosomal protein L25/general stress protein Ctc [Pseudomonadota bacterium]
MSQTFALSAEPRTNTGKGSARRSRKHNIIPGTIYGGDKQPQNINVSLFALVKQLENDGIFSHIIELTVAGEKESVILKGMQRHPAKELPIHVDFQRVDQKREITVHVPVHFLNEKLCAGVKAGGILSHQMTDLELTCLPKDLPEAIEIDVTDLALGAAIHVSEIKLPSGVKSVILMHGQDPSIVTVVPPTVEKAPTEEAPKTEES